MENISPTLVLLWDVKRAIEHGNSVNTGIKFFLNRQIGEVFQKEVKSWWLSQNNHNIIFDKRHLTTSRRLLIDILQQGLRGQSILANLNSLETELVLACEDEIESYVARLPLLSMLPLMFFLFPAMMLLLVMPLINLIQF